jgi:hypothetical protein
MIRKLCIALSASCGLAAMVVPASAADLGEPIYEEDRVAIACSIIDRFDRDRDGRLNIFEAKRAGKAAFAAINQGRSWTIQYDEVADRLDPASFDRANIIAIRGLDRLEWTRLVKDRFRAAAFDGRTIGCDELMTPEGRRFLAVTWY